MSLAPGVRLGPYEVVALLGAGGMGEVYRARDARLNRDVAIKILPGQFAADAERVARFQREAQVLASLNHPNIAHIHGLEEAGTSKALVLELVDGPTLADLIAKGPIPLNEALPIAKQIAEALETAHEHGIIHRDLKPANIKLTSDGTVKVLDFGLAKASQASDSGLSASGLSLSPTITSPAMATHAGIILGTAAYMSPEQAKGKTVDKRTDVWAFGCLLYEMLTGKRAFEGEDVSDTLAAILRGEPDWAAMPKELPQTIRTLIRRCLDKDRRRRIADIAAARFVLEEFPAQTPVAEAAQRHVPRSKKMAMRAAIALLALTAVVSSALLLVRPAAMSEPVRRLGVPIPAGQVLTHFALSPDGKRLAVTLVTGGSSAEIFLRDIDSNELQLLPGTAGARPLFWSPDSRSIGFFADGKLKVVAASGGPPQELCDGTGLGFGGTWNADGTILFGSGPRRPLRRVNAGGGTCTDVKVEEAFGYPVFLPDGKHFLYVGAGAPAKRGIYIGNLDDLSARRLLPDFSSALYTPSRSDPRNGYVIFLRDGNLMATLFDMRTMQVSGDVIRLADGASSSYSAPQLGADVSTDGLLVYLANRQETTRFVWFDSAGKEAEAVGAAAVQHSVQLSPNRQAFGFTRSDVGWIRDLVRGVENRFAEGGRLSTVWSPDARHIAYNQRGRMMIREMATGREDEPLATTNSKAPSDWSHDGTVLFYTEVNEKTQSDIWALMDPLNRSNRRRAVAFVNGASGESQAQISPNGRWVAYSSDESGQWAVYVRRFPEGTGATRVSPDDGREPRWSSDGTELYYLSGVTGRHTLNAVTVSATATQFNTGKIEKLFEFRGRPFVTQGNIFQYGVALNERRFLVNVMANDGEPTLNVITNWQQSMPK